MNILTFFSHSLANEIISNIIMYSFLVNCFRFMSSDEAETVSEIDLGISILTRERDKESIIINSDSCSCMSKRIFENEIFCKLINFFFRDNDILDENLFMK